MLETLISKIKEVGESYLMFSGGLDSCAILGAAQKAGIKITPVWINNGFGRAPETNIRQQAENLGNKNLIVLNIKPTFDVEVNPVNRCYFCKSQIISAIKELGKKYPIMDGTTGTDTGYRPGRKALNEHGVISPLAELDISSGQAKKMAIDMGADIKIADSESCIATRFNYNVPLKQKEVKIIKDIENLIISKTGDYNVRCRYDDADHIRIELSNNDSFCAFNDMDFRNSVLALGEQLAMFTTIDLKPSRPNAYDNRLKNDI